MKICLDENEKKKKIKVKNIKNKIYFRHTDFYDVFFLCCCGRDDENEGKRIFKFNKLNFTYINPSQLNSYSTKEWYKIKSKKAFLKESYKNMIHWGCECEQRSENLRKKKEYKKMLQHSDNTMMMTMGRRQKKKQKQQHYIQFFYIHFILLLAFLFLFSSIHNLSIALLSLVKELRISNFD
jgi:hypothetical protein